MSFCKRFKKDTEVLCSKCSFFKLCSGDREIEDILKEVELIADTCKCKDEILIIIKKEKK